MIKSNTYEVQVSADIDFTQEFWKDSNVPHVDFVYDQTDISECRMDELGNYYATYKTLVLTKETQFTIAYPTEVVTITVSAGEYGIKP